MQGGGGKGDFSMRARFCAVVVVLLAPLILVGGNRETAWAQVAAPGAPPGGQCAKADFEAVVNGAGAALRELAQQNTPVFQGKLRQLKDKRSWSNDEFMK